MRVGIHDASACALRAGAGGQNLTRLRQNMFIKELNQLRLLGLRWILDVVGDEDGAQARDGQRPWIEVRLQVINALRVGHGGGYRGLEEIEWDKNRVSATRLMFSRRDGQARFERELISDGVGVQWPGWRIKNADAGAARHSRFPQIAQICNEMR
jgi:hypothetical protein